MSFFKRFRWPFRRTALLVQPGLQGTVLDRVAAKGRHPASSQRLYRLYIPASCQTGKPAPLVMVLHGCLQTHLEIQSISGFDALAEQQGFMVVYPFVTGYSDIRIRNCWGWWLSRHIRPGSGEVEDLWQIVEQVASDFVVDHDRIHIAGLSSGAGMTVAALTVHRGRFASGMAVAGVAYGEGPRAALQLPFNIKRRYAPVNNTIALMRSVRHNDANLAPLLIVHSHDDDAVHIQAAENLRDSWLGYLGTDGEFDSQQVQHLTAGTAWTQTRYAGTAGPSVVETLFLRGPGHGWYGGAPGRFSYPHAPRITEIAWQFFQQHRRV